jgi:hypothetical protein
VNILFWRYNFVFSFERSGRELLVHNAAMIP